jgi:hypothetical protein
VTSDVEDPDFSICTVAFAMLAVLILAVFIGAGLGRLAGFDVVVPLERLS